MDTTHDISRTYILRRKNETVVVASRIEPNNGIRARSLLAKEGGEAVGRRVCLDKPYLPGSAGTPGRDPIAGLAVQGGAMELCACPSVSVQSTKSLSPTELSTMKKEKGSSSPRKIRAVRKEKAPKGRAPISCFLEHCEGSRHHWIGGGIGWLWSDPARTEAMGTMALAQQGKKTNNLRLRSEVDVFEVFFLMVNVGEEDVSALGTAYESNFGWMMMHWTQKKKKR